MKKQQLWILAYARMTETDNGKKQRKNDTGFLLSQE